MIEIQSQNIKKYCDVIVPGSKSYSHRILIAAALSDGTCSIQNDLKSEDTGLTLEALNRMGIRSEDDADGLRVHGAKGVLSACETPIHLGNSGTSMRLLTAVAALGTGVYHLTGTQRMQERPIQDLVESLNQIGVDASTVNNNGCPPVEVKGGRVKGGSIAINCGTSSQYLSALLLIAPCTQEGLEIHVTEGPVSKPYVDMTVDVMKQFGVAVDRNGYTDFKVRGQQIYTSGSYRVEPDGSQAGYFWAAAAVTGSTIKVKGITGKSSQGDVRLAKLLEAMGCELIQEQDGIKIRGGSLQAIEADMGDMPDMVPTLAVVAAFAKGTTVIHNVAHLRAKESDRLAAVAGELSKMGIETRTSADSLTVKGGTPRGATIETYNDHRIAMSFAIAGLVVPGVTILNETCVAKSFPNFWQVFEGLYEIVR
jgi:3-phosphoshikimate 1-carboxyvinyltransferase